MSFGEHEAFDSTTYEEVPVTVDPHDLLFKHHDHLVLVVEGVVKVEQVRVVEIVHDVDFVTDGCFVAGIRRVDELGDKISARSSFDDTMDNTKCTTAKQSHTHKNIKSTILQYKNHEISKP